MRVIIATTVFSMGIDCPNIRKVIHGGTPGTIEEHAQETGRAGRDGQPAKTCTYFMGIHLKMHHDRWNPMELMLHNVAETYFLKNFCFMIQALLKRIIYQNASAVTTVQRIVIV